MNSVYTINKGVGRPVVFKGLKAQWIWYLGGGILGLLLLFTLLYIMGLPVVFCITLIIFLGCMLFYLVYRFNARFGEYGLMKKMAAKAVPPVIYCDQMFRA